MAGANSTLDRYRRRQRVWNLLESPAVVHLVLFVAVFFIVAPLVWQLMTSFKTQEGVLALTYLPRDPTLAAYERALLDRRFWRAVVNSAIVASASTVIVMLLGTPAGYVFSRFRFPFDNAVFVFVLFMRLFPPIGLVTPYYQIMTTFGLLNTKIGIIIANVYLWLPLVIYIMRNFFISIPKEIDESALVDGCTQIQAFRKIVLPLAMPGVAAVGILTFLYSWREFLFSFMISNTLASRPISVAVYDFVGEVNISWEQMAAAAVLAIVPALLVVLFFQRYIVSGLTAGAMKGE